MARVGVLTSAHDADDPRIFEKQCKSLQRAGYDVTLIVPHHQDQLLDGVRIRAVSKAGGRLARATLTVSRIFREARRLDADLYHFHDPELIPVGLLLRLFGKRVIYDVHEDLPRAVLSKAYLPNWTRRLIASLAELATNVAAPRFSAVVVATPGIGHLFVRLNRKVVVVHNFPVLEELMLPEAPGLDQRASSVAYVGSMSEIRGIAQVVEAMALLPNALETRLELVGPFNTPGFREQLMQLPGWSRVNEHGIVNRAGVARILGATRAGLLPFHNVPAHEVAYPTKLFEYMSAGLPVIVSDVSPWREIVQEVGCGLLVDPLDPPAIATAIAYMVTHPEEAAAMGRRGLTAVRQRYSWASEEEKLLGLYRELTATPVRGAAAHPPASTASTS